MMVNRLAHVGTSQAQTPLPPAPVRPDMRPHSDYIDIMSNKQRHSTSLNTLTTQHVCRSSCHRLAVFGLVLLQCTAHALQQ